MPFTSSLSEIGEQSASHFDFTFEADRLLHGQEIADVRREERSARKQTQVAITTEAASWLERQLTLLATAHGNALPIQYGAINPADAMCVRDKLALAKHNVLQTSDLRWGKRTTDRALYDLGRDPFHFRSEARL